MSTTVQAIYTQICNDMLENGGLVLGVVTEAQFLTYLQEAILEFCQEVGLQKKIFTQMLLNTQSQYIIPDDLLQVQSAFVGGKYINRVSLEELQNSEYEWPKRSGTPLAWFEDGLPVSRIQLVPIPDYDGTEIQQPQPPFGDYGFFSTPSDGNLTTVASAGPNPITLTLGSTIPAMIPDSFTPYLVYRVLWRIASQDGEAKDLQRAYYCDARWKEGVALGKAIMGEAMSEDK